MAYGACDIDKLRDLVYRQLYAKRDYYDPRGYGPQLPSSEEVERHLLTYLAEGVTVAALTKCVEDIEAEAKERVGKQREQCKRRESKQRILRVCNAVIEHEKTYPPKHLPPIGHTHTQDAEVIIKEIGDPWENEDA